MYVYMIVTQDLVKQLHSQSSPGDLAVVEGQRNGKFSQNGKFGQNGKLGHSCVRVTKGRLYDSRVRDHVIVGAWSMAVTLWQQFDYYYCYYMYKFNHCIFLSLYSVTLCR